MKKVLALLLSLLMLFAFVACNDGATTQPPIDNGGASTDTGNGGSGTDNAGGDETPKTTPTSLTINGVAISEYTIVYGANPNAAFYRLHDDIVTQDTEYDKQTAENLAALIKEKFGAELRVLKDTQQSEGDKEIIIGSNTNREILPSLTSALSASTTSDKTYIIKENQGKIYIAGKTYGATWHGAEAFVADCLAQNAQVANIQKNYLLNGKADMLVVGCIGDSLTNGSGSAAGNSQGNIDSSNRALRQMIVAYPGVLQRNNWKTMSVYNYGQGGRTMIEDFVWTGDGNHAWNVTAEHDACMAKAWDLDLVLIMLGTNDANENRASQAGYSDIFGKTAYRDKFIQSCKNICDELKSKNADVRIVMLNCPHSTTTDNNTTLNISSFMLDFQQKAAEQLGLDYLDMYKKTRAAFFGGTITLPDGLHPSDKGYTEYAKIIGELISPIVDELLEK